jgi:hypothetical protein
MIPNFRSVVSEDDFLCFEIFATYVLPKINDVLQFHITYSTAVINSGLILYICSKLLYMNEKIITLLLMHECVQYGDNVS